jgi:hypothetical protein
MPRPPLSRATWSTAARLRSPSAFGALAANFRRLHAKASAAARNTALDPAAAAEAISRSGSWAVELNGRFVALLGVPDFAEEWSVFRAAFKSLGLEWEVLMRPKGEKGTSGGCQRMGLRLLDGCPKKIR